MNERKKKDRDWMVPVRLTYNMVVFVRAATAEEANERAKTGDWYDEYDATRDLVDWEVRGNAEPNE